MHFPPIEDFKPRKRMSQNAQMSRLKHLLQRDKTCRWCGCDVVRGAYGKRPEPNWATVDHVISHADGGSDDIGNLVLACYGCNTKRGKEQEFNTLTARQHAVAPNRLFGVFIRNGEAV